MFCGVTVWCMPMPFTCYHLGSRTFHRLTRDIHLLGRRNVCIYNNTKAIESPTSRFQEWKKRSWSVVTWSLGSFQHHYNSILCALIGFGCVRCARSDCVRVCEFIECMREKYIELKQLNHISANRVTAATASSRSYSSHINRRCCCWLLYTVVQSGQWIYLGNLGNLFLWYAVAINKFRLFLLRVQLTHIDDEWYPLFVSASIIKVHSTSRRSSMCARVCASERAVVSLLTLLCVTFSMRIILISHYLCFSIVAYLSASQIANRTSALTRTTWRQSTVDQAVQRVAGTSTTLRLRCVFSVARARVCFSDYFAFWFCQHDFAN